MTQQYIYLTRINFRIYFLTKRFVVDIHRKRDKFTHISILFSKMCLNTFGLHALF